MSKKKPKLGRARWKMGMRVRDLRDKDQVVGRIVSIKPSSLLVEYTTVMGTVNTCRRGYSFDSAKKNLVKEIDSIKKLGRGFGK